MSNSAINRHITRSRLDQSGLWGLNSITTRCTGKSCAAGKTITLLFAILFVIGLATSHAQNAWTQKADFGGTPRLNAVGFSIGSKGYLGTGYDNWGDYKKDFWEYDPVADAWTQRADFGGTARDGAVGFSIGS